MSHSPTHALSTRLFIQAALTGLLAPRVGGGSTWLVLTVAVAAGAVAVGFLMRSAAPADAKRLIVGFEGVALVVGGLGLAGGHYIPGTIVGVITLITALNMPAAGPVSPDAQWVPPPPGLQPAPAFAGAPGMSAGIAPMPVPDNPYAPPAAAFAPPAPMFPPPLPPAPAAEAQAPEPQPEPQPQRPEDLPPAARAMTILPGR